MKYSADHGERGRRAAPGRRPPSAAGRLLAIVLAAAWFVVVSVAALAIPPNTPITNTATATFTVAAQNYETTASHTVVSSPNAGNSAPSGVTVEPSRVAENAAGVLIGQLSGIDSDPGDGHSFSLLPGADPRFRIEGDRLLLAPGASLDFETEPTLLLPVRVTDASGSSADVSLGIQVDDVNEAPTDILPSGQTVTAEAAGAAVATLSTVDPDAGDTHTYSVTDPRFRIQGDQLLLAPGVSLALGESVDVLLRTTDAGGLFHEETLTVTGVPPGAGSGTPASLGFYQWAPGAASAQDTPVAATVCNGAGGAEILMLTDLDADPVALPADLALAPVALYKSGAWVFMELNDPDGNVDDQLRESVDVGVSGAGGDREQIQLTETAPASGRFVGYLPTSRRTPVAAGDCVLSVAVGGTIQADYQDRLDPADQALARALVDPLGLVFDSASGRPVNGAAVTLVDGVSGQPVAVFGDDGLSAYPATVVSGGRATDAAGTDYVFDAGTFRFPFIAPGDYRLTVVPPNRFRFPSQTDDATLQSLPGAPYELSEGSRGGLFSVPVGPAVRIDVPLDVVPLTPTASRLRLRTLGTGGSEQRSVSAGQCLRNGQFTALPPPVDAAGAPLALPASVALTDTDRIVRGQTLFVEVMDGDQDQDPFEPDQVIVDLLRVDGLDSETMVLLETGASTGLFVGYLPTDGGVPAAADCTLSGEPGGGFEIHYQDPADAADRRSLTATFAAGFTAFSSITGVPLDGVQVTLLDAATGAPAAGLVFAEDGVTPFPVTVTSGGTVVDGAGGSRTFETGTFDFPVVRPGEYRLQIDGRTPSGPVRFPSTRTDAELLDQQGSRRLTPGSRGAAFTVSAGISPGFDVPLDPLAAALVLTKDSNRTTAAVGDLLQYRIRLDNSAAGAATGALTLSDRLPRGFRYRPGSAYLDGAPLADPAVAGAGRELRFALPELTPGRTGELRYVVDVGPDTPEGTARNRATITAAAVPVSANEAVADVEIRDDLLSGSAILIGRVMNADCQVAAGAPGVPGVRVWLEDGTYVITDAEGKYHVEGLRPGTHVVQLDTASIPPGYEVRACRQNHRSAGRAYSQFVDLAAGALWRADFFVQEIPAAVQGVTAELQTRLVGGGLRYRLTLAPQGLPLQRPQATVMLPDGMRFRPGSARAGGEAVPDPEQPVPGALSFDLGALPGPAVLEFEALPDAVIPAAAELTARASIRFAHDGVRYQSPVLVSQVSGAVLGSGAVGEPLDLATVQFDSASAALTEDARAAVAALADRLAVESPGLLQVTGHTDALPIRAGTSGFADNQALSTARADAVAESLLAQLPAPIPLERRGLAATRPLAANDTEQGRARNRRVEIAALPAEPALTSAPVPDAPVAQTEVSVPVMQAAPAAASAPYQLPAVDDGTAPEFDAAWLDQQAPEFRIIWPPADYNPRIPSITVAVQHPADAEPVLLIDGALVNPMTFEGALREHRRNTAVSRWDNVAISERDSVIEVRLRQGDRLLTEQRTQAVHFGSAPISARLVPEASYLVADGITPPLVAVQLFDSQGRPARPGLTGEFSLDGPYQVYDEAGSAARLEGSTGYAQQRYRVRKEGIAYIQLEPTTTTGELSLVFPFDTHRVERVRARLRPGTQEWILVGLAEGTVAYQDVEGRMEALADSSVSEHLDVDGRAAFYAKGTVRGEWLLTASFDTDKEVERQIRQQIDPNRYYTLYGDGVEQRYDAESQRKLFLKLESRDLLALFGDFDTGFDRGEFTRFMRRLNGVQGLYFGETLGARLFAAQTDQRFVRDEIPGDGTSGVYRLSQSPLVINSEQITLVTRDRFRTEDVLERRSLTRYLDYTIDYERGTLIFKSPVFSQDTAFNPIFIEAEYETEPDAVNDKLVYGARLSARLPGDDSEAGVVYLRDETLGQGGELLGADVDWAFRPNTRLALEFARSEVDTVAGAERADAYRAELSRRGSRLAGRLYLREQEAGFGLGQQTGLEAGLRKYGLEGEYVLAESLRLLAEAFEQQDLDQSSERRVLQAELEWLRGANRFAAGARSVGERLPNGERRDAGLLTGGASRALFGNRLVLRGDAELDMSGSADNVDYPSRAIVGADYALTGGVRLLLEQELTFGAARDTQQTRLGLKSRPWSGADLNTAVSRQRAENGERVFATTGLSQQWRVNERWLLDFGADRAQTLTGSRGPAVDATYRPGSLLASGTRTDGAGANEDFTALFAGFGYRHDRWDAASRVERHQGEAADKWNWLAGASHQLADGKVFSTSALLTLEQRAEGGRQDRGEWRLGLAWRPTDGPWTFLDRLDFAYERQRGGGFESRSRKFVNNFNANYAPELGRQLSFYLGLKYVDEQLQQDRFDALTALAALEYRRAVGDHWDIGLQSAVLGSTGSETLRYSLGLSVGRTLLTNIWISAGYNLLGFEDADFDDAEYRARGPFIRFRLKLDQDLVRRFLGYVGQSRTPLLPGD